MFEGGLLVHSIEVSPCVIIGYLLIEMYTDGELDDAGEDDSKWKISIYLIENAPQRRRLCETE